MLLNKILSSFFIKEINITDIILFEGGTFTHTGIKTCGLIFEKDKKGTKEINFIQANKECNILTKITTVLIDDIEKDIKYTKIVKHNISMWSVALVEGHKSNQT